MNKYENDFVYGRDRLKKLLIFTAIGCALSLLTPLYSYIQIAFLFMTCVLFVTALVCVFKYCRCPSCGKVIFFGVLAVKDCPRCHRNLVTGKKTKKGKSR